MSEHTRTPWKVTGTHFVDAPIGGGRLQEVAWCGDVEHGDRQANARHIVHCVNNYERLVEALEEVRAFLYLYDRDNVRAEKVISAVDGALQAGKGGE